jgi:hypothetical protein
VSLSDDFNGLAFRIGYEIAVIITKQNILAFVADDDGRLEVSQVPQGEALRFQFVQRCRSIAVPLPQQLTVAPQPVVGGLCSGLSHRPLGLFLLMSVCAASGAAKARMGTVGQEISPAIVAGFMEGLMPLVCHWLCFCIFITL